MEAIVNNVTAVATEVEETIATDAGVLGRQVVSSVAELEDGFLDKAARIDTYPGSDVPGKDINVYMYTRENLWEAVEQLDFEGNYPHRCIATCLDTVWCYGVVAISQKCWFRGGLVSGLKSAERVEGSLVPAGDDHTVYVLHRASPLLGVALLVVPLLVLLCVFICVCKCCCKKPPPPPEPEAPFPPPKAEPVTLSQRASASLHRIAGQLGEAVARTERRSRVPQVGDRIRTPSKKKGLVAEIMPDGRARVVFDKDGELSGPGGADGDGPTAGAPTEGGRRSRRRRRRARPRSVPRRRGRAWPSASSARASRPDTTGSCASRSPRGPTRCCEKVFDRRLVVVSRGVLPVLHSSSLFARLVH